MEKIRKRVKEIILDCFVDRIATLTDEVAEKKAANKMEKLNRKIESLKDDFPGLSERWNQTKNQ